MWMKDSHLSLLESGNARLHRQPSRPRSDTCQPGLAAFGTLARSCDHKMPRSGLCKQIYQETCLRKGGSGRLSNLTRMRGAEIALR